MRSRARDLAKWATSSYRLMQKENPAMTDREIFSKLLDQRVQFPAGQAAKDAVLDRYGSSIYGICYFLGLNTGGMESSMVLRCLQFLQYLTAAMQSAGAGPLSPDLKRDYFRKLDLPEDAADKNHL